MKFEAIAVMGGLLLGAGGVNAYPGGTPNYQTDVAPFCASCHSSTRVQDLAGRGERADKEVAERKHISLILGGRGDGYAALGEADRATLAAQVRAVDAASTVRLDAPQVVKRGASFEVTVSLTGGAGPVVGVALVDLDHRWYARPATAVGWSMVGAPKIIGADGQPDMDWLDERPADLGRNLTYVNIPDIASDAASGQWAKASVTFTLRAPDTAGKLPLAAVYFYGTEKASVLGYTTSAVGRKRVRGGMFSGSGRVKFTAVQQIQVD